APAWPTDPQDAELGSLAWTSAFPRLRTVHRGQGPGVCPFRLARLVGFRYRGHRRHGLSHHELAVHGIATGTALIHRGGNRRRPQQSKSAVRIARAWRAGSRAYGDVSVPG